MRYASVCDGIGAVHVAWKPLGWECAWTSEIEPFPIAVVEQRHALPNVGDMTKVDDETLARHGPISLLVGGTPCQSFSVAGLRRGMADPRGNLALSFLALADQARPRWLVWENVPGVLSSGGGRDFGSFIGGLAELGYGWAYRVLDAQYFGLAQRRKRVFVVGRLGDRSRAAAVLLERESLRWNPPPSREAGKGPAGSLAPGAHPGGFNGQDAYNGTLISPSLRAQSNSSHRADSELFVPDVAFTCRTQDRRIGNGHNQTMIVHALRGEGHDASEDGTGRGTPLCFDETQVTSAANYSAPRPGDPCHPLASGARPPAIALSPTIGADIARQAGGHPGIEEYAAAILDAESVDLQNGGLQGDVCGTLQAAQDTGNRGYGVMSRMSVRRLTPRECERLQGFPDDYTLVDYRGKLASDAPRYKALGNSMAVPVMRWIGRRIEMVDAVATTAPPA